MTIADARPVYLSWVSSEIGWSATAGQSLGWVRDNSKDGLTNLDGIRGRAWYQKNNAGNCNNGNCTSNCNCGNIQCTNCYIAYNINCVNCDGRAWLQGNCNCACTYNCGTGQVSYNCNCDCDCNCNCSS